MKNTCRSTIRVRLRFGRRRIEIDAVVEFRRVLISEREKLIWKKIEFFAKLLSSKYLFTSVLGTRENISILKPQTTRRRTKYEASCVRSPEVCLIVDIRNEQVLCDFAREYREGKSKDRNFLQFLRVQKKEKIRRRQYDLSTRENAAGAYSDKFWKFVFRRKFRSRAYVLMSLVRSSSCTMENNDAGQKKCFLSFFLDQLHTPSNCVDRVFARNKTNRVSAEKSKKKKITRVAGLQI